MAGMRLNKYIAASTGLSRRAADQAITDGRVLLNRQPATLGDQVVTSDTVSLDGKPVTPLVKTTTIILNKPFGYVVSRNGQGSETVYDLLPGQYQNLNPVGRLDKDSSGLLLLTNDGELANQLTHPRYGKSKQYQITLDKPLEPLHQQMINDHGVQLGDGPSQLNLAKLDDRGLSWQVAMSEGRNRQIRRTFASLGYDVRKLHRTRFGNYQLGEITPGNWQAAD
jgi:23S rRNA pseudouridine2605 synthase